MNRTKLVQFFATVADLEPGFRSIESKQRLTLAEQRYYESKSIQTIDSLFSIPNLGKVTDRRSPRYVVQPTAKNFHPARVVQVGKKKDFPPKLAMALALIGIQPPGGKVVYDIQLVNHSAGIIFAPGGFWNPETLIAGEIATIHDTAASMELYNLFRKELLRGFTSVQSFEVGPEALAFLKSGGRLTIDAKAAPMLDLMLA
jgi:hypothetical protein